jgi:hypothetical protein
MITLRRNCEIKYNPDSGNLICKENYVQNSKIECNHKGNMNIGCFKLIILE